MYDLQTVLDKRTPAQTQSHQRGFCASTQSACNDKRTMKQKADDLRKHNQNPIPITIYVDIIWNVMFVFFSSEIHLKPNPERISSNLHVDQPNRRNRRGQNGRRDDSGYGSHYSDVLGCSASSGKENNVMYRFLGMWKERRQQGALFFRSLCQGKS